MLLNKDLANSIGLHFEQGVLILWYDVVSNNMSWRVTLCQVERVQH